MHVEFKYQNESLLYLSSRLNSLNTRRKSTARAYLGPRENYIVSSRVSVPHPIFRLPHPFLPIPLPKKNILNMSSLLRATPLKISGNWLLPWKVPLSENAKTHFLKKEKILLPTMKYQQFERWNINIRLQTLKIKGELGFF